MGYFLSVPMKYECELCQKEFKDLDSLYEHYSNSCDVMNNHDSNDVEYHKLANLTKFLSRVIISNNVHKKLDIFIPNVKK